MKLLQRGREDHTLELPMQGNSSDFDSKVKVKMKVTKS